MKMGWSKTKVKIGTQLFLVIMLSGSILLSQSFLNSSHLYRKSEEMYPLFQRRDILVNDIQFFNIPIDSLRIAFNMSCNPYNNGVRTCSNNYLTFIDNNARVISFTLFNKNGLLKNPNISVGMKVADLKKNYPDLFANVRTDTYKSVLYKVVSFYDLNENEIRLYLNRNSLVLIRYYESEEF